MYIWHCWNRQELTLSRGAGEKLGIHVQGGVGSRCGNPFDSTDEGIFISQILDNGVVARDGRLVTGQRILEVNR